jgi:putative transposase
MARQVRSEYPGASYHVINRVNYRQWVFREDGAKRAFEECW